MTNSDGDVSLWFAVVEQPPLAHRQITDSQNLLQLGNQWREVVGDDLPEDVKACGATGPVCHAATYCTSAS